MSQRGNHGDSVLPHRNRKALRSDKRARLIDMIRRLNDRLGIPAEILIQPKRHKKAA